MSANRIKINYSVEKKASFQFMSDNGKWIDVHEGSPLSQNKYASAIADGRIDELLEVINETYNIGGRGVIISFIGNEETFKKIIPYAHKYEALEIERKEAKSIISGKRNVGKTCLIEGIFNLFGKNPHVDEEKDYVRYFDDEEGIVLYEIKGIDLGLDNVNRAYNSIVRCIENGAAVVFYCFFAKAGKIEDTEIDLIARIENEHPPVRVIPVITGCIDERKANEFANRIEKELGKREVLITLAKDMNTKAGLISSFGIEAVIKFIRRQ